MRLSRHFNCGNYENDGINYYEIEMNCHWYEFASNLFQVSSLTDINFFLTVPIGSMKM